MSLSTFKRRFAQLYVDLLRRATTNSSLSYNLLSMVSIERKVLDVVRSCFSSEVIYLLDVKFNAEEDKVKAALGHTIPLAVNSLLSMGQAESRADVAGQLAHEAAAAGLPHNVAALTTAGWGIRGSVLMQTFLDDAYGMTLHCLAATSIRPVKGETILGYTMARTLGALRNLLHNATCANLNSWLGA